MATRTDTSRLSARIVRRITRGIASGTYKPGDRLPPERDVARRYGVSRVSVREAYRSLEELRVIEVRRGRDGGAYITTPDAAAIQMCLSTMLRLGRMSDGELQDALAIEPIVARLAARHAEPADVEHLEQVVEREEHALAQGAWTDRHRSDFRRALAACTRNILLTALVNSLTDLDERRGDRLASSDARSERICELHRAMLDAIASRDEEAAYFLMQEVESIRDPATSAGSPIAAAARAPHSPLGSDAPADTALVGAR